MQLRKQQIVKELKKRCIYLEHQAISIEGVTIFGSPFTKMYCGSAFQYHEQYDQQIWSYVPKGVDILVTHCPPLGILDKTCKGINAGSKSLREVSLNRKPKFHIFGHIHESRGSTKIEDTQFINVACNGTRFYI